MKKLNIVFAIYSATIVLGISAFLLFYPKFSNKTPTFATKISLNCPREITFEIGDEILLNEDFVSIEPSELLPSMKHTIYTKTNKTNPENLTLNSRILSAEQVGFYYIKFSVPGKNFELTETLVVHVVEKDSLGNDLQKVSTLDMNKEYDICNLFEIKIDKPYEFSFDSTLLDFSNGKICARDKENFDFSINYNFKLYTYISKMNFSVNDSLIPEEDPNPDINPPVSPEPDNPGNEPDTPEENPQSDYSIEITNHGSTTITFNCDEDNEFNIKYLVKFKNEICQNQIVNVSTNMPDVCKIVSCDAPYITIQYLGTKATFELTIKYDDLSTKVLTITFA